ncbi:hypothetical protein [Candidatus Symbiopectobacterium sp.]|uniref:hypothetical protein n=1 Tax=Candidatus Symbiopectobacterium sp. TaxID=2816440 RepID=UPI0025BD05B1|nr:hypothetical protein [Candidatus Symbiopectobacterium sp.]
MVICSDDYPKVLFIQQSLGGVMKKLIVVIFAYMTLFVGSALAFTRDGFYSINSNDWVANSTPPPRVTYLYVANVGQ